MILESKGVEVLSDCGGLILGDLVELNDSISIDIFTGTPLVTKWEANLFAKLPDVTDDALDGHVLARVESRRNLGLRRTTRGTGTASYHYVALI